MALLRWPGLRRRTLCHHWGRRPGGAASWRASPRSWRRAPPLCSTTTTGEGLGSFRNAELLLVLSHTQSQGSFMTDPQFMHS